jgi:hypothetical protein
MINFDPYTVRPGVYIYIYVVYQSMAGTATRLAIGTEEEYIKHEEKGKRNNRKNGKGRRRRGMVRKEE